jgi:hypothetical protein
MAIVLIALSVVMLFAIWPLLALASNDEPAAWPHWPVFQQE